MKLMVDPNTIIKNILGDWGGGGGGGGAVNLALASITQPMHVVNFTIICSNHVLLLYC